MSPPEESSQATSAIRLVGARTHNLKNINLDLPRDRLVVVTGPSGGGKSSLIFDTIHAEGQRRYLETLLLSRRAMLDELPRPEIHSLTGLPPTLAVSQRSASVGRRSTLATATEIADYLRLLYARAGRAHSPHGGAPLARQSLPQIVESVLDYGERAKVMILAPLKCDGAAPSETLANIAKEGFVRGRLDGTIVDLANPPADLGSPQRIEAVIDRIIVKEGVAERLRESLALALKLGEGVCLVTRAAGDGWEDERFSEHFICPETGRTFPPLAPRSFSFNNPHGACPKCRGLGEIETNPGATRRRRSRQWRKCPECQGERLGEFSRLVTVAGMRWPELVALPVAEALAWCETLTRRLEEHSNSLEMSKTGRLAAERLLPDLAARLAYLERVGLGYLTLARPTKSLSGGELQRARLAGAIGSGLVGVCYLLDEPTSGLHPRDIDRLLGILRELRDAGNSVVVVEHDLATIAAAETVVEIGPGAGRQGGEVVAMGRPAEIAADPASATGPFLSGIHASEGEHSSSKAVVDQRRLNSCESGYGQHSSGKAVVDQQTPRLLLRNVTRHNVANLDLDIPLQRFVAVTGVSGSGKSSLVIEALVPLVRSALAGEAEEQGSLGRLDPASSLPRRLVLVDQQPLGRTSRSTPATYCGIWKEIRRLFAQTRQARQLGFGRKRFSYLAKEGRCGECAGAGAVRLAMKFLPELTIPCPRCQGRRFNHQTLRVRFRGKSVADVLAMRVDEAMAFFAGFAKMESRLRLLDEVGLGYLTLGQSALTLSGGEAQRVRLGRELSLPGQLTTEPTLFVLDEPTTGLHPVDTRRLLALLRRLVADGHSVIAIEHEPTFIAAADWVIDLGPGAGPQGGRLLAAGTPDEIAARDDSWTGRALGGTFAYRVSS